MISFSCPAETETPNWRTTWGHRAAIADRVRQAVRNSTPDPPTWPAPHFVRITRVGPATLDDDNLVSACKAARDEVAKWLGLDDGDPRLTWTYAQRKELVRDPNPRRRRVLRTWLEVDVSDEPLSEGPRASGPVPPPERLEREKKRPDVFVAHARKPLAEIEVGTAGVRVALCSNPETGGEYVRISKHYVQQGHAWRTSGVVIDDIPATIAALKKIAKRS